jgi:hypothetical protein
LGNYGGRRSRAGDLHNQRKKEALLRLKLGARLTALTMAASLPGRSLPLSPSPEIVQPSHFETLELRRNNTYGFKATFNEKAFGDFWKPFATIRTDITQ